MGQVPTPVVFDYLSKVSTRLRVQTEAQDSNSDQRPTEGQRTIDYHPIARIRHFLSSQSLTEHYLFLSCLVALDASLWAGIPVTRKETPDPSASLAPEVTSVLDQWEVERIMGFLESDDIGIRALVCLCKCLLSPISDLLYFVHAYIFESRRSSSSAHYLVSLRSATLVQSRRYGSLPAQTLEAMDVLALWSQALSSRSLCRQLHKRYPIGRQKL